MGVLGEIPSGVSPSPDMMGAPGGVTPVEGGPSGGSGAPGGPQDDETCSEASFSSTEEPLSPEEKMAMAISLKDAGNKLFKEGNFSGALEKYKEGEKHLKKATGSEATAVSVQLSSNSCMCCLKLERWQQAIDAANRVLTTEPKNLKALYRRAIARSNLGYLSQAKEDLMAVIAVDSTNAEARKELAKLKEKILAAKAEDKKAYSGLFSRASGLYDDREAEREKKKKEEEAENARRKTEWQKEMEKRKEKGLEEEGFEEWLKKTKEAEEKEREQRQKEQAKRDTPLGGLKRRSTKEGSPSSSSNTTNSSSSVMEVDEEDAEIIKETKKMGYCYFRRNLTDEEKELNAQNRPTKITTAADEVSPHSEASSNRDASTHKTAEGKSISQWNAKGTTYEEKDVSPWARTRFAERLQEAHVLCGNGESASPEALLQACLKATEALGKDGATKTDDTAMQQLMKGCFTTKVETVSVGEVTGDAHLAVVRGTRRVFFDMKCSLQLSVKCSAAGPLSLPGRDTGAANAMKDGLGSYESKGTLTLPDVSSADGSGMSWLDGSSLSLATPPSALFKPMVDEAIMKFKESVAEKIQAFLDDCKALP